MIETNRLNTKKVLNLISRKNIERIFLDVDHTIIATDRGMEATIPMLNKIYPKLGETTNSIHEIIHNAKADFEGMKLNEQKKYLDLVKYFEEVQNNFSKKWGLKMWSRETIIMKAAEDLGLKLTVRQVVDIAQKYWEIVSKFAGYYEDAIPFLKKIKNEKIPIFWVTGSDSLLRLSRDKKKLVYDPKYSKQKKQERLKKLVSDYPGKLIIGDPIDKPKIWEKVFDKWVINNTNKLLAVGNSYDTDLKVAEELRIKTILITRK